jgi:hypothetical protein
VRNKATAPTRAPTEETPTPESPGQNRKQDETKLVDSKGTNESSEDKDKKKKKLRSILDSFRR